MAIPLVTLVGLLAFVVGTTVNNAVSLDRAPNLVNATAVPAANFGNYVQAERAAAVVYLFQPTAANLQAYQTAIAATDKAKPAFMTAMTSGATVRTETASGTKTINGIVSGLNKLPDLRNAVKARLLNPLDALGFYSQGTADEVKLFLIQTESVVANDQQSQAVGLIATVQAREQLSEEDALLAGMLAGQRMSQKDHIAFSQMAATRQADMAYASYILSPANLATYNAVLAKSGPMQQNLTNIEQAITAGTPVTKLAVTPAQWQQLAGTLLRGEYDGGVAVANAILVADHQLSHAAWVRVAVTSGVGLAGLLLTVALTILVGRGIIRRLGGLERNALQLAETQLPDVVGRLRRGEDVDVNAEAPPLRIGRDEIGRVGQAFDLVRQTAIRAAVDEARLRQGLNDVFRSLARRSQSLLHRQLTLLDQMERRASDPEALDDLFRLDHLTTRMRRHAEGLVILAGAPPGRGWSSPVRMVDVMRGAIAEVEDYARVSVATRSQAALAGSAVADVIHLLAELIENGTTLSPPYTSVRVSGDTVANGFAIEVEDRGLGMSPARLAELNERLASPPEFNPSDSEQLGLFVVSQLAKRHGIRVTLKASPYGGTAAITLIPRHLVVTEEAFRAGLPGELASVTAAQLTSNGNHAAAAELAGQGPGSGSGFTELDGRPGLAQTPGFRISGPLRRAQGIIPERPDRGAHTAPALGAANGAADRGPDDLPRRQHAQPGTPADAGQVPFSISPSPFDVFMPRGNQQEADETPPSYRAGDPAPYPDPGPGPGPAPDQDQPARFPGWTLRNTPGAPGGRTAPDPGTPAGPATPMTPMTPVASSRPGPGARPPWELSRETGPLPAVPGGSASGSMGLDPDEPGADGDIKRLPRRVRQASLAPQLRDSPPPRRTTVASAGPSGVSAGSTGSAGATGPSPAEIRKTMSSLQRGWQEGRSRRMADQAPRDPTGPTPTADASRVRQSGPDTSPGEGGGHDSTANEETRGDSDGS